MCGIFGGVAISGASTKRLARLAKHARSRGSDASGFIISANGKYEIRREHSPIDKLLKESTLRKFGKIEFLLGHSRLSTNSADESQPISRESIAVAHNGIVLNHEKLWTELGLNRNQEIDSEIIAAIAENSMSVGLPVESVADHILSLCEGSISAGIVFQNIGKLLLFSNTGDLYIGFIDSEIYFASESFPLTSIGCTSISQVMESVVLDIPSCQSAAIQKQAMDKPRVSLTKLGMDRREERLLRFEVNNDRRCTKCILPATMPFIRFDEYGVCNYCHEHRLQTNKPIADLEQLVQRYTHGKGANCIIPFSGGRDSTYALHLAVNELNLKPVTFTYDWGMLTDLGRRNISLMCAKLNVPNIVIASDIGRKRKNIQMNLATWLKRPTLGMLSLLTAGDKHFFKYIEDVQKQTGIQLNLWGINPLETTHFKAGFLGVPPDFELTGVYSKGLGKQARYQSLRLKEFVINPGYFNSSVWDTLSGEYYRSFRRRDHYFHMFDYWKWDENNIEKNTE